jgi:hypothetical protein
MKNFLFLAVLVCLIANTCAAQTSSSPGVPLKAKVVVETKNLSTGSGQTFSSTVDEISKDPNLVFSINGTGYSERGFFRTDKTHPFVMVSKEMEFIRLFPDANSLPWLSGENVIIKETKKKLIFSGNLRKKDSEETLFVKITIFKK